MVRSFALRPSRVDWTSSTLGNRTLNCFPLGPCTLPSKSNRRKSHLQKWPSDSTWILRLQFWCALQGRKYLPRTPERNAGVCHSIWNDGRQFKCHSHRRAAQGKDEFFMLCCRNCSRLELGSSQATTKVRNIIDSYSKANYFCQYQARWKRACLISRFISPIWGFVEFPNFMLPLGYRRQFRVS